MALLNWDEKYSIGIKDIDKQHKGLIDTMNELQDGMKTAKAKDTLKDIVDKLVKYAEVHFYDEELYMSSCKFPGLEDHKRKHKEFTNKVHEFKNKFNLESYMTSLEVMVFLKKWFMDHILETDREYIPYLNKK